VLPIAVAFWKSLWRVEIVAKKNKLTKRSGTLLGLVLLAAISFFAGWLLRGWQIGSDVGLMAQVHHYLLAEAYPSAVPTGRELGYAAVRGMLRETADSHAALIVPPLSYRVQDDFAGKSGVIGLYAEKHNGEMVTEVVLAGEPAEQAGILPGDVLLSVDDIEFNEDTTDAEATYLMRGPVGQPAHVVIRRGQDILEFDPVRQPRPKVSTQMIQNIGYIYQHTFTTDASELMKNVLIEVLAQNPRAIIWDLRSNGGGSMEAAQTILNYFIEDGILFTAEQSRGRVREFKADKQKIIDADVPLVVLIGERTYSAAETAAATISETGRGITIGSTSFGKGTIQATIPLANDCLLQLTVAKWLSPSGQWYDGRGVEPDISVQDDPNTQEDEVLQYAVNYVLQGKATHPGAGN
jgi:carboxyl-terminal processing protease